MGFHCSRSSPGGLRQAVRHAAVPVPIKGRRRQQWRGKGERGFRLMIGVEADTCRSVVEEESLETGISSTRSSRINLTFGPRSVPASSKSISSTLSCGCVLPASPASPGSESGAAFKSVPSMAAALTLRSPRTSTSRSRSCLPHEPRADLSLSLPPPSAASSLCRKSEKLRAYEPATCGGGYGVRGHGEAWMCWGRLA